MKRSAASFLLLIPASLLLATGLYAQIAGSGVIQGTILDPSGAPVPSAEVTAVKLATGVKTTALTTEAGFYVLSPLSVGEYSLTVSAKGFQTVVQEKPIPVHALSIVELNFTLTLGALAQQVTVTAAPPILNTSDGTLGTTVPNETYTALPLAMGVTGPGAIGPRNPEAFIYLLPGVSNGQGFAGNVNGGEMLSKSIYIQGIPLFNCDVTGQNVPLATSTSVDSVDQFKMITNGAPAQYEGQGIENFVFKSGTNSFHGSVYDYFRNTVLDARGFFPAKRQKENENEYGFTFGGPIRKNRVFFFGDYSAYRQRFGSVPQFNALPTAAERNGDFSALPVAIYDPATTQCDASGKCTRQQFQGNIITADRISPVAKYFQSMLPNTINDQLQNNYLGVLQSGQNNDTYLVKVDANISDKLRLYALHNWGKNTTVGIYRSAGNSLPLPYTDSRGNGYISTLERVGATYIIGPRLVNQATVSYSYFNSPFWNYTVGGNYVQKSGLTGVPAGLTQFPGFAFSGPNAPIGWASPGMTSASPIYKSPTFLVNDDVQWVHGKHSMALGTQLAFPQKNRQGALYNATFGFLNTETGGFDAGGKLLASTGNAYASYLLGQVDNASLTWDASGTQGQRLRNYALYVQDDWKATRRLTINLGLRYDIAKPWVEVYDRWSFLNPTLPNSAAGGAPGIVQFGGFGTDSCQCRTLVRTHYKDFGPRVGLAYQLNDKTVLRAAYGIFYVPAGEVGGSSLVATSLGFAANPIFTSPDTGIHPAFNLAQGFPAFTPPPIYDPTLNTGFTTAIPVGKGNADYIDPELSGKQSYYQNWNFTVQRQVTPNLTVTVAYAASAGHFLPTGVGRGIWSNQMNPKYLVLGTLLSASATPQNIAAAQAIFPEVKLPYPNFSGAIGQALRPFAQYSGINDRANKIGNSTYNSLQVSAEKRYSSGMSLLIAYTWEKTIDNAGSILGGSYGSRSRTAYNTKQEKAISVSDVPHTLVATWVYQLPFGSGHNLGNNNPVIRALVSGWQVSTILMYRSGVPLGPITATGIAPNTGTIYADLNPAFSGPVRINGSWGSGDLLGKTSPAFIDKNAFGVPASYTLGNSPRTMPYGLRNPWFPNENIALRREFKIRENLRFALEGNAFNAFNRTVFGSIGTNISNANFGKVGTQSNLPREFQLVGKIIF
ncbi:MAG: TonB-dependent receptor [Acidobacteriia bacterium]|nr:TonB-dependent receptor [Terriglobia bacterium]